jgi:hypothetical protein
LPRVRRLEDLATAGGIITRRFARGRAARAVGQGFPVVLLQCSMLRVARLRATIRFQIAKIWRAANVLLGLWLGREVFKIFLCIDIRFEIFSFSQFPQLFA